MSVQEIDLEGERVLIQDGAKRSDFVKGGHPEAELKGAVSKEQMEAVELLGRLHAQHSDQLNKEAKYKIEVVFGSGRTPLGQPNGNPCVISVYESGKRLDGGGDVLAYWCDRVDEGTRTAKFAPGAKRSQIGCRKIITEEYITHATVPTKDQGLATINRVVCPHCGRKWSAGQVTGQVYGRWTTSQLAKVLVDMWSRLEGNCDIYLKYHYTDIRYIAMERRHGTAAARQHRGAAIYPLQNIIKDTSNGADIEGRFKVFLQQ